MADILQAIEFMDSHTMNLTAAKFGEVFEKRHPFYALIEVASNSDPEIVSEDTERLVEFIGSLQVLDGIVPSGEK